MKTVCVVLVDRANFGRLHPLMSEIKKSDRMTLKTICAGSMLLPRFGEPKNQVKEMDFEIDGEVSCELEGTSNFSMAQSVGVATMLFASEFQRIKPDWVLLIGDRYEALAAATAALFMNIRIAHVQGGEVSGSVDESTRHCITKMAHLHFPATERSAEFIKRMGEDPTAVFNFGCPSGDYILNLQDQKILEEINQKGSGLKIDFSKNFLMVLFHPVTTELRETEETFKHLLGALCNVKTQIVWLWPNIDAGSNSLSKMIRAWLAAGKLNHVRMVTNLSPETYQTALKFCACAVGNSSSFVRDSTFSGVPVVLLGNRQNQREFAENVYPLTENITEALITNAVNSQINHGPYNPSFLYGNGNSSKSISAQLASFNCKLQKTLFYVYE